MALCLSNPPHVFPQTNQFPRRRTQKFGSDDALLLLRECTHFRQLRQIHARIIRSGLSQDQLLVRKLLSLISAYGEIDYAGLVFGQVQNPLTFTWNLMIRAYSVNGYPRKALLLYNLMICRGSKPDKFTFPFVIKACVSASEIDKGKEVHALAIKTGFSGDLFVQHTLMDLYMKCGNVECGRNVFDKMSVRNVVSWTTMVTGLVRCGDLEAAREVFERMPCRNVVSWTAMINGYVVHRQPEVAFELFSRMQLDNLQPNEFTLVSLLRACTELGSLKLGRRIHDFALKNGFELGVFLGTALVDMYSKCGSLEDARQVFDMMQTRSLATWNSMITSLGVHGFGKEALLLFELMERAKVQPNEVTFVGVLCACVNTNDVEAGHRYFTYMSEQYGIVPIFEHYTCMIELYSRNRMLDQLSSLLNAMPVKPSDSITSALLTTKTI